MNRLIQELARLLRDEAIRRDVSIRLVLANDLPQLEMDPVQIQQVLLNLAMNGMDAMMRDCTGRANSAIRSEKLGEDEILVASGGPWPGHRTRDCGANVRAFFHHQATGDRHGPGNLPRHYRSARRADLGGEPGIVAAPSYNSQCGRNHDERAGCREEAKETVFIVDDDESIREGLSNFLEAVGINVKCYSTAEGFQRALVWSHGGVPASGCAPTRNQRR